MKLKRTGIFTKIIIIALLIYGVASLVVLRARINEAESLRDSLSSTVADMTARNDEMRYALEHSEDESVLEDIARENDYVYNDEEVYKTE